MIRMPNSTVILIGAAVSILAPPAFSGTPDRAVSGPLPGDPAPRIQASAWLRGEPVEQYEPGRLYLVDLWATWCGPCLASMPLLRTYEARFGEKLTVIAMNVWELNPDGIPAFVDSLADSLPGYVAVDSVPPAKEANEGLTALAFLGTSALASIPRTYLIDGSGRIAWIGTPHGLEGPLTRVLDGTWDVDAHARGYALELETEVRYLKLFEPVEAAVAAREWASALEASEAVVSADPSFGPRISHQGFVYLAMEILRREDRTGDALSIAGRAMSRAIELDIAPDWQILLLAARVAKAGGDLDEAARFLDDARLHVPPESRHLVPATVDTLPIGR